METYPVTVQQIEFAGSSVVEKLKDLREKLTNEKARGIIITTLDEVNLSYNWSHSSAFIFDLSLRISITRIFTIFQIFFVFV